MNKILIGKGNLQKFAQDYELTVAINKGQMWSQLYPVPVSQNVNTEHPEFAQMYEYVIGYTILEEVKPIVKKEEFVF